MGFSQDISKDWQRHVQAFERSGMTRRHYCEQNQIRLYQLDYWRKKVRKVNSVAETPTTNFIPVRIRDDQAVGQSSVICLRVGRLAIEVRPGFDRDLLAEVIRVVDPTC